jgi:hypothetical protein
VKASVPHESFMRGDGGEVPLGVRLLEHELMERLYDVQLWEDLSSVDLNVKNDLAALLGSVTSSFARNHLGTHRN